MVRLLALTSSPLFNEGMDKPTVALWFNLARSGGTLIARCLGCMDRVVLLSEVHPLGVRMIDPALQALRWHGLVKKQELADFQPPRCRYDQMICKLAQRTRHGGHQQQGHLVLRDWSHLDFLGVPFTTPSMESRSARVLMQGCILHQFATVRHPMDQWISQQRLDMLRNQVDPVVYLEGVLAFAHLASQTGFVRYEDFTREPGPTLAVLCEGLGIPFDPTWSDKYAHYAKVTGDQATMAARIGPIRRATRHDAPKEIHALFMASDAYRKTCALLGYEI